MKVGIRRTEGFSKKRLLCKWTDADVQPLDSTAKWVRQQAWVTSDPTLTPKFLQWEHT